jgi:hypothetical protein
MNYLVLFLTSLLVLGGCASSEMPKDWYPITTIIERPSLWGVESGTVTTISPYLIVQDIDKFWVQNPIGSVQLEALRRHEVLHAERQEAYPLGKREWLQRYILDKEFRWQEESAGWRLDLLYLLSHGYQINVDDIVNILSGKEYFNMVEPERARQWVLDVLAGRV